MEAPLPPFRKSTDGKKVRHTIQSLRLDLDAAREGRTWLLLPDGFRDADSGKDYPLPTEAADIQALIAINIPLRKSDSGCIYLKRAIKRWKTQHSRLPRSPVLDIERRQAKADKAAYNYTQHMRLLRIEARNAVEQVKIQAAESAASLTELFSLGRQGLRGMMEAHLKNEEWKGEAISASAFRDCFRMVSQTVKALGLPSDQRKDATVAVMDEVAAALKSTQEALAMQPGDVDRSEPS